MRRYLLTVYLLFSASASQAQLVPTAAVASWAVRWAPLSLLDPRRPTLQLGAEYFPTPDFSVGADVGTRAVVVPSYRQPGENRRHQTYRLEGRRYLASGRSQSFVAVEMFFVPYRFTSRYGLLQRDGIYYTYDQARIRHNTWGTALKYGWRIALDRHGRWYTELALGLGVRRKPARYSRIRNEQPADSAAIDNRLEREWTLGTQPADGGHVDRLHFAFSVRVGYQLFRRATAGPR